MKLVNINKNGTQKFELKDGRIIYSYTSGYVRIDGGLDRLYQINRVRKVPPTKDYKWESVERILIPCPQERFQYIVDWVSRNVKDIPYSITRELKYKTAWIKYIQNK
tara:strand:+ start:212 stop:532 length:321 start_codon:yes stop_codon:yes gene_type:complete